MKTLRVIVGDDHALMRNAVRAAFQASVGIEIVGEAETGRAVIALARSTKADVVLLDIRMPGMDGFHCLDALRNTHPDLKVVIFTAVDDPMSVSEAMERGASGYVMKSVDPADLASVLRQICDGNLFRAVMDGGSDSSGAAAALGLTVKEREVLDALARGLSNRAIAKELWLTEQTIKFHLTNIYRKLGVTSRTEATRFAYEKDLVRSPLYETA
jgi:DNA-binding NarL/FixJ family response regulator